MAGYQATHCIVAGGMSIKYALKSEEVFITHDH